jgi:hypothetical protein
MYDKLSATPQTANQNIPTAESTTLMTTSSSTSMTNVTPKELEQILLNHTEAQGEPLVQPYIGKMMKVSGPVVNVSTKEGKTPDVSFLTLESRFLIIMEFSSTQLDSVRSLNRGDQITVIGGIRDVSLEALVLTDCSFEFTHEKRSHVRN